MATSAFKSKTKRLSIAGSGGGGTDDSLSSSSTGKAQHRRSRSLSLFSRRLPSELDEEAAAPAADYRAAPRGKFVNTVRGSEFAEISLDDLALEFFSPKDSKVYDDGGNSRSGKNTDDDEGISGGERGRSRPGRRESGLGRWASETASSKRRGRSVSRNLRDAALENKKVVVSGASGGKPVNSEANSRRRRSLSVARFRRSDSESDADHFQSYNSHCDVKNVNTLNGQIQRTSRSADRRLRKSHSQIDLAHFHDGYSSQSSVFTDEDTKDGRSAKSGDERTIRTVFAQKAENPVVMSSGLYEVMRKELRYAVEGIRTELEQAMVRNDETMGSNTTLALDRSNGIHDFSAIRRSYATRLEQSQKRKQELLSEMLLEDQRGIELSKIVKELLPESKNSSEMQKTSHARKRSTDRNRMSNRLTEEAERYFEDFISNVEDTDISSFDGERSDGSSTLGGTTKAIIYNFGVTENFQSPEESNPPTVEMDGVILPWLQWETNNDGSLKDKNKVKTPITPTTLKWEAEQGTPLKRDPGNYSISSHGSSKPGLTNGGFLSTNKFGGDEKADYGTGQRSSFDMSDYLVQSYNEDYLFERYKERHQIHSGGLLLCTNFL